MPPPPVIPGTPAPVPPTTTEAAALIPLPESSTDVRAATAGVPDYILEHAPLVYLHSKEPHFPSDVLTHIKNCTPKPYVEEQAIPDSIFGTYGLLAHPLVNNEKTFLTSKNNVCRTLDAEWICSPQGKPDTNGLSPVGRAVLIVVNKDEIAPGTVDAFWFLFYSFNLGPVVIGLHFGNHGTEHFMIRFKDGVPQTAHLSAHADGFSYTYAALEKKGKRPVIYSAIGSHALYPTSGKHDYSPVKVLGPIDYTDTGYLWDPFLNHRPFKYTHTDARDQFEPFNVEDEAFLPCLKYRGQWGDRYSLIIDPNEKWWVKLGAKRIRRAITLHKLRWGDGISGPRDKDLNRTNMNRWGDEIKDSIIGA